MCGELADLGAYGTPRQAGELEFRYKIGHREARLLEALGTPHSLNQLVAQHMIYGKPKAPQFVYDHIEGQMLAKHLDRLLRQGLIARTLASFQRF